MALGDGLHDGSGGIGTDGVIEAKEPEQGRSFRSRRLVTQAT
jgi:hypothetical protein